MRSFFLVCLAAFSLAAAGCAATAERAPVPNLPQAMPVDPPGGSYMLTANTYAGDALHTMMLLRMGSGGGILTTSFVNIHDFEQTSAFGRLTSQQVGSRLGQYGFRVIEARLASSLSMAPRSGEFMLTRETARLLADTYDAHSVLVGSYSDEGGTIFVSARVVRLSDNVIMAAYEYYLPRDGDVSRLLSSGGGGGQHGDATWDRYNRRTPAFPQGLPQPVTVSSAPAAPPSPAKDKAAFTRSGVSSRDAGPAVPRHVDPTAKAAAPVPAKKAPPAPVAKASAPAAPVPVPAAPVTLPTEKDAPAPSSVPGGV